MNALGINQGTSGNVSVRAGDGFLVTASGIPYDAMEPEHVVEMDLDGGYRGEFLPSSEWRMHLDVYRARPEAGAVVHAHSTYATALACLRVDIPAFHYMVAVGGGPSIRCSSYAEFGTQALSDAMLVALEGRSACLLGNHGQLAFGDDLAKALARAVEVEALSQQYWAARLAGAPALLDEAQMASVLVRFRSYGKQPDELTAAEPPAVAPPTRRDAPRKRGRSHPPH
jgi:L-fuculose-phosphate aldolase